ncbi:MAG: hypothetical protein HYW15_03140 [Candidatus Giovannonibacteria bacterium]|nr:MAG: hypothetical protein HYW15_03140 [Candidatus Giovannonibacteria bacterium]
MLARFARFLVLFDILLVAGVIIFLHYGVSRFDVSGPTDISAWMAMVDWSMGLVLFLFYLLLVVLIVIFINYVRRTKE